LMRKGAKTTLLPFSTTVDTPEPFSADKEQLKDRIDRLTAVGGTLIYDATYAGVETLMAGELKGKVAVVALTDGRDEGPGSRRSEDAVIARAREARVPLYMLGLGAADDINEDVMKKMARETGGEYYQAGTERKLLEVFESLSIQLHDDGIDEESLGRLAKETGGRYSHVSKLDDLSFIYERLAEELQQTYRVRFKSRRPKDDGVARDIDVAVRRAGKYVSTFGRADDVARGIAVPQMSYPVYLTFLAGLLGLLAVPGGVRRIYKAMGGA
ncbi:MAG: vWA domain-containing protein, partial [Gemmataceae bacterium]